MSGAMDPRRAMAQVPGWAGVEFAVEKLGGGLTNRTFRLRRDAESFMLRLDAEHQPDIGLDRDCELSILERASESKLAPEIVFADPEGGILITRFVEGRPWTSEDLNDRHKLVRIAELLQEVHALPSSGRRFLVGSIAAVYSSKLKSVPGLHAFGERCVEIILRSGSDSQIRCCHNDVVAANIVGNGRLTLIDWEYACDNEALFDLASLIGYHDLNRRRADVLLGAYTGDAGSEPRERLELQLRIYDALHWLWLAVRQTMNPGSRQERRLRELQGRIA